MGVVINRPSDKTVREVWEMIGNDPCDRDDLIFVGGPVPGPLVALHRSRRLPITRCCPVCIVSTQPRRARLDRPQEGRAAAAVQRQRRLGQRAARRRNGSRRLAFDAGDHRRCVRRSRNDLEDGDAADRAGDHGARSRPRAHAAGSVAELADAACELIVSSACFTKSLRDATCRTRHNRHSFPCAAADVLSESKSCSQFLCGCSAGTRRNI